MVSQPISPKTIDVWLVVDNSKSNRQERFQRMDVKYILYM